MSEGFDLEYSKDALLNRVLFISGKNKINFFVEDTNKEYEYEELLEKIFSDDLKINCIFPTNGKPYLIEAFDLFGNDDNYGKNIFIADGDFDVLLEIPMVSAVNFIYLEKYNIESYLIDKEATLKCMRPRLHKEKAKVEDQVDFPFWYSKVIPFLKKVFALHCLVQKESLGIINVARNPNSFFLPDGLPNESQYEKYKEEIMVEIDEFEDRYSSIKEDMREKEQGDDLKFICGKYLLESLSLYLNKITKNKQKVEKLKSDLIARIDANRFNYLRDRIVSYLIT